MKDTYTFGELGFVFAITFLVGFFGACQLMQWYQVDPLKKTAIQKGYASYTIPNTNEPTLSVFTWK
jgi:hypothetical protein